MSYKVKMQFWHNGMLVTHVHEFDDPAFALEFAQGITKKSLIRVYNEFNELIHQIIPRSEEHTSELQSH